MTSEYFIKQYTEDKAAEWDDFIAQQAVNATFLQSRRFLNYHPIGRFEDASYLIYDKKNHLAAVCPACAIRTENAKKFVSHQGSTFGGVLFGEKFYYAHKVIGILQTLEETLKQQGFSSIEFRLTPDVFSRRPGALLEYSLYYLGYWASDELNTYIDYREYKEDILSNFDQGKRGNVHNCMKAGLATRALCEHHEIADFYRILCDNLKKYNTRPVHTLEELIDFKEHRLSQECGFYGVYAGEKMLGGSMMFYFRPAQVAHTQYLCACAEYRTLSPMTFLYYSMIKEMKKQGYRAITFGISTEEDGRILNYGLTQSKEAYRGQHFLNKTYYKEL